MNPNSPEYFVRWTKDRFFNISPEDFENKGEAILPAIKSWIAIGNEHCSSYKPWIALRTHIFLICYVNGYDIIEDCMDLSLAKEILGEKIDECEVINFSKENLKEELILQVGEYMKEFKTDQQVENFFVRLFAAYTVMLNKIKMLDSFKNNANKFVEIGVNHGIKR